MKDWLESYLNLRKSIYIQDPSICISFFNEERERKNEYNGRQVLELIQNAEDASTNDKSGVWISLTSSEFIFANRGLPFSEKGVESLMTPNVSSKLRDNSSIGSKGLGFRSLLSWAHSIQIISGDLSIEFSRESAIMFLSEIYSEKPEVQQYHVSTINDPYPIPTLAAPRWVPIDSNSYNEYDTYIIIKFNQSGVYQDILNQLQKIQSGELLFLRKLNTIEITTAEFTRRIEKETQSASRKIKIRTSNSKQGSEDTDFSIYTKEGLIPESLKRNPSSNDRYELKIAIEDTLRNGHNVLYSYFRTRVHFKFPAIIHGTFELSGDRERIVNTPLNQFLVDQLCDLLIETGLELTKQEVSWKALQLLTFDQATESSLSDFSFSIKLLKKIKEHKLFPSVHEKYLSFYDEPVFYKHAFAKVVDFRKYKILFNLLKFTDNPDLLSLCVKVGTYIFTEKALSESLSKISPQFTFEERARLVLFLDKSDLLKENMLPNLLIDEDKAIIPVGTDIFLPPDSEAIKIPSFVKLKFIHPGLIAHLKTQTGKKSGRDLLPLISRFNVTEYAFVPVFRKMLAAELEQRGKEGDGALGSIVEILGCVYAFWRKEKQPPGLSELKIELPNRKGEFVPSNRLFLGYEYLGGELLEKLLQDESRFLASPDMLGIPGEEKEVFFEWLGVKSAIPVSRFSIKSPGRPYITELAKSLTYPFISDVYKIVFTSPQQFIDNHRDPELIADNCIDLDTILLKAKPEHILAWFITDGRINSKISVRNDPKATYTFHVPNKQYKDNVPPGRIPSWIQYKIAHAKWLPSSQGSKRSPSECVLLDQSAFAARFIAIPKIDYTDEIFTKYQVSRERIEATLKDIGVKINFSQFSQRQIYGILLDLPTVDPSGESAKQIYRMILADFNPIEIDPKEANYIKFKSEGRILAKQMGKTSYQHNSKCFYLDNVLYGEGVTNRIFIAEFDRRRGRQKVQTIFGVAPVETIKFRASGSSVIHNLNDGFLSDFETFKVMFYSDRVVRDHEKIELHALRDLSVVLCSSVFAEFSLDGTFWEPLILNNNEYVTLPNEAGTIVYVYIAGGENETLQRLKEDVNFCDAIINIVVNSVKLVGDDEYRYLYSLPDKGRVTWLLKHFNGDLTPYEGAKAIFGISDNMIFNFWYPIAQYLRIALTPTNENEQLSKVLSPILPLDLFLKIYDSIDYASVNSENNHHILSELFSRINLSIVQYNQNAKIAINCLPAYRKLIAKINHETEDRFTLALYEAYKERDLTEQSDFFFILNSFKVIHSSVEVENNFNEDCSGKFRETVLQAFGIDLSKVSHGKAISVLYQESIEFVSSNFEDSLPNSFTTDPAYQILILFRHLTDVWEKLEAFNRHLNGAGMESRNGSAPNPILKQIANSNNHGAIVKGTGGNPTTSNGSQKQSTTANWPKDKIRKGNVSDFRKSEIGLAGELAVFKFLEHCEWASEVKWLSRNSENYTGIPGDDSLGYDIRYINAEGQLRYAEVKATVGSFLEFTLTQNELSVAQEKKTSYEVILVTDVESHHRRFYFIKDIIEDRPDYDFFTSPRFNIESASYQIVLTGQEPYFTIEK